METQFLLGSRRRTIPSFNFLASLINGNVFRLLSAEISSSFNFLASLINGNCWQRRDFSVLMAFNFLASLINGNLKGSETESPETVTF